MEYGSESGGVWNDSEGGGERNMALREEVSGIWLCEWRCVECG